MPTLTPDETFIKRMHALPRELFDQIFEEFLEVPDSAVTVSHFYKPPVQLQLCKSIREDYAKKYYSREFILSFGALDEGGCMRWMQSVEPAHLALTRIYGMWPSYDVALEYRWLSGRMGKRD